MLREREERLRMQGKGIHHLVPRPLEGTLCFGREHKGFSSRLDSGSKTYTTVIRPMVGMHMQGSHHHLVPRPLEGSA